VNTIDHVPNEFLLRSAESSLVRDVEHAIVGLSMLTVGTTDLNVVLISDLLELRIVGRRRKLGQFNMHGSSQGSTKVSGARSDVTKVLILSEFAELLNLGSSSGESREDCLDVGTRLHRDNSELIFLIDPDQESLGSVVEDTTTRGPVTVEIASFEESVTFFEKEVIINELFLSCFIHSFERIESTLEIFVEVSGSFGNDVHDLESLFLGDTWTKREIGEVSSNTDTGGVDHIRLGFSKGSVHETLGIHISLVGSFTPCL